VVGATVGTYLGEVTRSGRYPTKNPSKGAARPSNAGSQRLPRLFNQREGYNHIAFPLKRSFHRINRLLVCPASCRFGCSSIRIRYGLPTHVTFLATGSLGGAPLIHRDGVAISHLQLRVSSYHLPNMRAHTPQGDPPGSARRGSVTGNNNFRASTGSGLPRPQTSLRESRVS